MPEALHCETARMPMRSRKIPIWILLTSVVLLTFLLGYLGAPRWLVILIAACIAVGWVYYDTHYDRERTIPTRKVAKYVSPYSVTFDDDEIVVSIDGKPSEVVTWDDLIFIGLRIENQGFIDVPYWLLGGRVKNCTFPSDAIGHELVLEEFAKRLPGYNSKEVYLAISVAMCAVEGGFVVWKKASETHPAPCATQPPPP